MTVYVKITTVYDRGDCNIYLEYVRWAYNIIERGELIKVAEGIKNDFKR